MTSNCNFTDSNQMISKINSFYLLKKDWDTYNSDPLYPPAIQRFMDFYLLLLKEPNINKITKFSIGPCDLGVSLQIWGNNKETLWIQTDYFSDGEYPYDDLNHVNKATLHIAFWPDSLANMEFLGGLTNEEGVTTLIKYLNRLS